MSELIFESQKRFRIWKDNDGAVPLLTFIDRLSPKTVQSKHLNSFCIKHQASRRLALRLLMPSCIDLEPLLPRNRPATSQDNYFWQYPAITERLALDNHKETSGTDLLLTSRSSVDSYIGLPWATFIDKKTTPRLVRQVFRTRILGYQRLAEEWGMRWGEDVLVHTVCQHVNWDRMLVLWKAMGITDAHLSHCESSSEGIASNYGIKVHSWSLAAANIVNNSRAEEIAFRKLEDKKYLASFIGSYLYNHRSNVRIRLRDEANRDGGTDILVHLNREWHFNSVVYQEQIEGSPLNERQLSTDHLLTKKYNRLLSNSIFSLCPEGAGPNTIRLWESLAAGSIPVVIVEDWIWPPIPRRDLSWRDCVVRVSRCQIRGLFDRLRQMKATQEEKLVKMQLNGRRVYESFCQMSCF